MRPIDQVLNALTGVKPQPKREGRRECYIALCPSHNDNTPSLSVDLANDGTLLILCRACGAKAPEVLRALNMEAKDLYSEDERAKHRENVSVPYIYKGTETEKSKIVATFDYYDEQDNLVYQVCRREPGKDGRKKDFFQRRPDGKGGWVNGLGECRRILYRLGDIIQSEADETIWIVEGEKVVEIAKEELGIVATTNVGGAGKWREEYNEYFRGRNVAILPDNDTPGKNHASKVKSALESICESVTVVELPGLREKEDVEQWVAKGGTGELLLGLLEKTKHRFPRPKPSSLLEHSGHGGWIWEGYLAYSEVTLFSALWKAGKTTLLTHLIKSMEVDGEFCGLKLSQSRVLYITEESENQWATRRDDLNLQDHIQFVIRPFDTKPNWQDWHEFLLYIRQVRENTNPDLIVFDPISNLWPVRDENDATQVQEALMPLRSSFGGSSGLIVHHHRKGDGNEATAARGSGSFTAWVDTIMELRRFNPMNRQDTRRIITSYGRSDETKQEIVLKLHNGAFVAVGDTREARQEEIQTNLLSILPIEPPGFTFDQIKENWPFDEVPRKTDILRAVGKLVEESVVTQQGEGKRGDPKTYWTAAPSL